MCAILHHGFPVAEDVSCSIEAYTAGGMWNNHKNVILLMADGTEYKYTV